jgi:hypothetical protein
MGVTKQLSIEHGMFQLQEVEASNILVKREEGSGVNGKLKLKNIAVAKKILLIHDWLWQLFTVTLHLSLVIEAL